MTMTPSNLVGPVPAFAPGPGPINTDPPPGIPIIQTQPDGTLIVLPLSYFGYTGDDAGPINDALQRCHEIAGGPSQYGGSYNGPWQFGTVQLGPYDYQIQSTIVKPPAVNLVGHRGGTRLFVAAGVIGIYSHVAMGGPQVSSPAQMTMGAIRDLWIDGSAGAASGIDFGGAWGAEITGVSMVNFTANGAIGLHLNNAPNSVAAEWTEKCKIECHIKHCNIACVIENSSSNPQSDSFEYNDITLYIILDNTTSPSPQQGIILRGGAYLSGGSLKVRGNFPANSGPVLNITGSDGSGGWSSIYHSFVDITVESNANTNQPQTIVFGNANNFIHICLGILTFQFASWVPSNATAANFQFKGVIDGDNALLAANAAVTTPGVPAANTDQANLTQTDVMVYISGGTGVAVKVDGVATGLAAGSFYVPDDGVINLGNYSVAPTWHWVGML
jgi:hypothetical protein